MIGIKYARSEIHYHPSLPVWSGKEINRVDKDEGKLSEYYQEVFLLAKEG